MRSTPLRLGSQGLRARLIATLASVTLVLALAAPVAATGPFGTVSVDAEAGIDVHTGVVTVSGFVDCTAAGSIEILINATQQIGQAIVPGFGFGSVVCPGADTSIAWNAEFSADGGFSTPA